MVDINKINKLGSRGEISILSAYLFCLHLPDRHLAGIRHYHGTKAGKKV